MTNSKYLHFMANSYKKELLYAIAGDGKQVGIGLVLGRSATDFTYEPRPTVDNRVGMSGHDGLGQQRGL